MKRLLVLDIETDGTTPFGGRLLCVGYQFADQESAQVVVPSIEPAAWDTVIGYLADPDIDLVTQSKYDVRWLRQAGYAVNGQVYDTMVMAWLINENTPLGLEWLAKRYLHETMDKRIRSSGGKPVFKTDSGSEVPLGEAPVTEVAAYNKRDVETTTRLFLYLRKRMQDTAWWTYYVNEHLPFTLTLINTECNGLPVDLAASEQLREELEVSSQLLLRDQLSAMGFPESFNMNSGPQLSLALFSKVFELTDSIALDEWEMGALKSCVNGEHEDCFEAQDNEDPFDGEQGDVCIQALLPNRFHADKLGRLLVHGRWTLKGLGLTPGILTPSGDRPSTSSPALLTNMATATHPWVTGLLRYRKMTKVLTTYLNKFREVAHEGRVYGSFNQTGTVTGRLSSSQPNLQNIPAHGELGPRVRNLFRAPEGSQLLVGDYSQLEPRLMAHYSQDPLLLEVYRTGADIYLTTAKAIWQEDVDKDDERRQIAKTYVLAMGYGAGIKKLQQILTINGFPIPLPEVEWQFARLREAYASFFTWREATIRRARRMGYVQTIAGQHRRLAAQFKSNTWKARGYGERQAVNAIIQGSAGDIVRRTMMQFDRNYPELRMLAQVHDELVFQFDDPRVGEKMLPEYAHVAETAHGFELSVPLVFEPHVGETWYSAKEGTTFVLPESFEAPFEDADAEEDEDG